MTFNLFSGHGLVIKGLDEGTGVLGDWADGLCATLVEESCSGGLVSQHKLVVEPIVGQLDSHLHTHTPENMSYREGY